MIAPLLVLVILGVLEYGRLLMVQQVVTNAAREGSRMAALEGTSTSEIAQRISDYLADNGMDGETVTVTPDPPTSAPVGTPVSVDVQLNLDDHGWLPSPVSLAGKVMTASSTMRRESSN